MQRFVRRDSTDSDFIQLVRLLDEDLAIRDGEDHAFYSQFNKTHMIKHIIVAYNNDKAIGCGAIKKFDNTRAEIKRMFILPNFRGRGFASKILLELEKWAIELDFKKCILETGIKQPEAISLYSKNGYSLIPNYGQYTGVDESKCFEKSI